MISDIRVNYGVLEDITDDMRKYRDALCTMSDVIRTVNNELSNNKGKSIEELKKLSKSIYKDIDSCKDELKSLYEIFSGYCNDMQSIIKPVNKSKLMQVDRNDIWFNMKQIKNSCTSIKNLSKAGNASIGYSYLTKNKEKIQNEKNNYNNMKQIWAAINKYGGRINTAYSDIEYIYNKKIVPYEDMDDNYAKKAKTLYSKYTNIFESLRSIVITTGKNIVSPVIGLAAGLWDSIVGIVELIIGAGKLILMEAGALIGVVVDKATGQVPKWLKYCMDKSSKYNDMIGAVLKDPAIIVEGIGQDISDKIEEKGILYSTGHIVGSLLGLKGLDKLGKVAKASKAAKKVKGLEKLSKADDVANVDGVYKSLLGEMSAEEAKLYGKFLEQGSTAGLTAIEKEALAKVESKLLFSKINGDEILNLRNGISSNINGVQAGYKSLLGEMSTKEAELYGKFLEQGSTAGLSAIEKEALAKVESKLALSKVNGNEILELRKNVFSKIDDVGKSGNYSSLRDLMSPEEAARYDAYWNNVADDMLKSNLSDFRSAVLGGDITKTTGGKINSKVVTAAIDTNTGEIYYGISGMNNNPTRNMTNPQMQEILNSVNGSMTNYPLENCGEFNAINNALNNGADIRNLRVYSIDRVNGNYKAPCINCQNLYGNIVYFTN